MSTKKGVKRSSAEASSSVDKDSKATSNKKLPKKKKKKAQAKPKPTAEEKAQRKLRKEKRQLVGAMLHDLHQLDLVVTPSLKANPKLAEALHISTLAVGECVVAVGMAQIIEALSSQQHENVPPLLLFRARGDECYRSEWIPEATEVLLSLEAMKLVEKFSDFGTYGDDDILHDHKEFKSMEEIFDAILGDADLKEIYTT